jgi:hypothetical protein
MVPYHPTATPLLLSVKYTEVRSLIVPELWETHRVPPLVVFAMVPYLPTTYPVFSSEKNRDFRSFPVGDGFDHCQPWASAWESNKVKQKIMIDLFIDRVYLREVTICHCKNNLNPNNQTHMSDN